MDNSESRILPSTAHAANAVLAWSLPVITAAIFTASTLLFWVQPMFGKMVLPLLGGTPAVWTAALLFFQTTLLLGYLYAHGLARYLDTNTQVIVHVSVLTLASLVLPIFVPTGTAPPADGSHTLWLIGLFATTVGLPYFAVAATSPLLQHWFAGLSHHSQASPYRLYVASNIGSLLGLMGYPLIIEPLAGVSIQTAIWSAGFLVMLVLIASSGLLAMHVARPNANGRSFNSARPALLPISNSSRIAWVALAFVPSSLLMGVTTHLTTDIAAIPLLWALPLSLYLISFILAFSERSVLTRETLLKIEAFALVMLAALMWFDGSNLLGLVIHVAAFFCIAWARHSELSTTKPPAENLTEFYLWLSVGGALGGVFNALVAPQIFSGAYEYPVALAIAAWTRPALTAQSLRRIEWQDFALPALLTLATTASLIWDVSWTDASPILIVMILSPLSLWLYHLQSRPLGFALALTAVFAALIARHDPQIQLQTRSFFGTYRVISDTNGAYRLLAHGTTIHGAQATDEAGKLTPLTYYAPEGPLGDVIRQAQTRQNSLHIGVVGLGVGASACYSRAADQWTMFEIDPLVVKLATDTSRFSFLAQCTPRARIVTGDARIALTHETQASFDVLILDAFSSDSIPTHLMTREAFKLFTAKLKSGGMIAFNISNRHLHLAPIIAKLAASVGLDNRSRLFTASEDQKKRWVTSSHWMALSASRENIATLQASSGWHRVSPLEAIPLWTDDYTNLLSALSSPEISPSRR